MKSLHFELVEFYIKHQIKLLKLIFSPSDAPTPHMTLFRFLAERTNSGSPHPALLLLLLLSLFSLFYICCSFTEKWTRMWGVKRLGRGGGGVGGGRETYYKFRCKTSSTHDETQSQLDTTTPWGPLWCLFISSRGTIHQPLYPSIDLLHSHRKRTSLQRTFVS